MIRGTTRVEKRFQDNLLLRTNKKKQGRGAWKPAPLPCF
jgi:hypothetical protein